jgi:hypothetical protein
VRANDKPDLSCGKAAGVRKFPAGDAIPGFRRRRDFAKDNCANTCFTFADAARQQKKSGCRPCRRQHVAGSPVDDRPVNDSHVTGSHAANATIHPMLIDPDPARPRKSRTLRRRRHTKLQQARRRTAAGSRD